jgi:hypothetical protein
MRLPSRILFFVLTLGAGHRSLAQAPLPEITFTDPPGFYRSAIYPPADFSSQEVNASLQMYPFRQFNGEIRQAFARTLLRELIDPRYQETSVAPGARLDSGSYPGADYVLRVRFQDVVVGPPGRERMRFVFVVGTSVAILDAQAATMQSWQHVLPQLNTFLPTVKIGAGTPEPAYGAPAGAAGTRLAGLYQGFASKYMTNLQLGPGYGTYQNALLYYVFSANGRVYRHYDALNVPGNDPARFDFAGAKRADPENSGQYVINGDSVYVRIGTPSNSETFAARLPSGKIIVIKTVQYTRQ